eukprot:gene21584-biopygen7449
MPADKYENLLDTGGCRYSLVGVPGRVCRYSLVDAGSHIFRSFSHMHWFRGTYSGSSQMAHDDTLSTLAGNSLDSGQSGPDSVVVLDDTIANGDIEVHSQEHPLVVHWPEE